MKKICAVLLFSFATMALAGCASNPSGDGSASQGASKEKSSDGAKPKQY